MNFRTTEGLGGAAAFALVVLGASITYGVFLTYSLVVGGPAGAEYTSASDDVDRLRWMYALAPACGLSVAAYIGWSLGLSDQRVRESLKLSSAGMPLLLIAFFAGVCFQFPLSELGNWIYEVKPMSLEKQLELRRLLEPSDWSGTLGALFGLVVVPAIFEELLFRGVLLPGLVHRYGMLRAVLLSSLLFALSHLALAAVIYAMVGGVVFALLRLRTGSLWVPVAMHMGVNIVPLVLSPSLLPIRGFNVVSEQALHLPWWLVVMSCCGVACGVALLWRFASPGDVDE